MNSLRKVIAEPSRGISIWREVLQNPFDEKNSHFFFSSLTNKVPQGLHWLIDFQKDLVIKGVEKEKAIGNIKTLCDALVFHVSFHNLEPSSLTDIFSLTQGTDAWVSASQISDSANTDCPETVEGVNDAYLTSSSNYPNPSDQLHILRQGGQSYQITKFINNGGFAFVFKAKNAFNECFAIKLQPREKTRDSRFIEEFGIARSMNDSPYSANVYELSKTTHFMVMRMELIDGIDLLNYCHFFRPQVPKLIPPLLSAVIKLLQYMKEKNTTELDFKPANFMYADGVIKKIDWGFAIQLSDPPTRSFNTQLLGHKHGTRLYQLPSIEVYSVNNISRAQMHSLAVTFLEISTGTNGETFLQDQGNAYLKHSISKNHRNQVAALMEQKQEAALMQFLRVIDKMLAADFTHQNLIIQLGKVRDSYFRTYLS